MNRFRWQKILLGLACTILLAGSPTMYCATPHGIAPRASLAPVGSAPTASISPVSGPFQIFDGSGATNGTAHYLVDPEGAATVIDTGKGVVLVNASAPCILVQVVVSGKQVATAAIEVEGPTPVPIPVTPPSPDPNPIPPVGPTPVPPTPSPVVPPNSGIYSIAVVHAAAADSAAVLSGLTSATGAAFWESQKAAGRGTYLWIAANDPWVAQVSVQLKLPPLPAVVICDAQDPNNQKPLAAQTYSGDNSQVQALIDSLKTKAKGQSHSGDDWH